jgi:NTP pyrophosphatase (non-canonical NTP hydrolase)
MSDMFTDVVTFNSMVVSKRFEANLPPQVQGDRVSLQGKLIQEELEELREELDTYDGSEESRAKTAKELCDVLYVVLGLGFHLNLDLNPVWEKVHRNNMEKIVHGRFREDGKLIKPDRFTTYKPTEVPDIYDDLYDFVAPV